MRVTETPTDHTTAWLFVFALVGFYAVFLFDNALNIPQVDDYSTLLGFLSSYLDADTWSQRASLLFAKPSEHLLLLNRVVALGQYYLTGALNFRQLVFIGNGFVLLTFLLFVRQLPAGTGRPLQLMLGALMLFQPLAWHSGTWAMAALSNFGVWPLGLIALAAANHTVLSWQRLLVALFFGLAACFTLGNGVIVLLLIPLAIAFRVRDWRAWLLAAIWLLAAFALYDLVLANKGELVQARTVNALKLVLHVPHKALLYHLVLTGYFFTDQVVLAAVFGIAGVAYSCLCLVDLVKGRASTCALFILFIMGTLTVASLLRGPLSFLDLNISHRYWYYSQLFWFCTALDALSRLAGNPWLERDAWPGRGLLVLMLALALSRYVTADSGISALNRDKRVGQEAWLVAGHPLSNRHLALASLAEKDLRTAIDKDIYRPFSNHPQFVKLESDSDSGTASVNACDTGRARAAPGAVRFEMSPGAYLHRLTGWTQFDYTLGLPTALWLCTGGGELRLPWRWTEVYMGLDQVDWEQGNIFSLYYLFEPLPTPVEQVVIEMRGSQRFLLAVESAQAQ
ncbi:MAG: hypothetical protein AAGI24_14725 [Pseudomonadota bacterium]